MAQSDSCSASQKGLEQDKLENDDDFSESNNDVDCFMQFKHGLHCVQIKSAPVLITAL